MQKIQKQEGGHLLFYTTVHQPSKLVYLIYKEVFGDRNVF